MANVLVKQTAERTETLEAHFKADIGDSQPARGEKLLCLLYSALGQVLMGSLIERGPEEPQEMKPG